MIRTWSGRMAAAVSLLFLVLTPVRAADPPGILWATTSQPTMEGMPFPMPMQKMNLCVAREWTQAPAGGNPNCKNSNFRQVGNKATWTVQCSGDMPMSGVGEMIFEGTDAYTGTVKLSAEGMSMLIRLTGKKTGTCDNPQ